ncbi:MAG: hypothetical protein ACYS9X_30670, partial [Planctomycetota bacterium]
MPAKAIRDVSPGDEIDCVLLVREANVAKTRAGKPYVRAKLADRTGEIDAIQWDAGEGALANFPAGGYVRLRAVAESYKGRVNIKIQKARAAREGEYDPADFLV